MGEKGDNNLDKIVINIKFHKKGGRNICTNNPFGSGNVNLCTFSKIAERNMLILIQSLIDLTKN
jgi:hypothetical protein